MFFTTPALAQAPADAGSKDREIAEMMLRSQGAYSTTRSRTECYERAASGEIVVCAQDDSRFRAQSTSDVDPLSSQALNDGSIRPPDLEPKYPGFTAARGCFIPPCPKGPAYFVDLEAIPDAPAGSDADLIGRGEKRAP
ncbi:hypothetical protein [Novosphingobium aquimarinum]|uniref:hypothetical protein n=1 Tax=Novosphingobium aquimarinum TaxID=2682494 RepID=UPI0012EC92A9|nr:hypothetical protein [Novosphingobium aquimarinum]